MPMVKLVAAAARARRLPGPQRREHLLDVAAALLRSDGFEALTMEGVAQRAGVSKGLGYAYFDNAEELALALFEREVGEIYRRVEEAMSSGAVFEARVRAALGAYLDVVAARGGLFAILQTKLSGRRLKRSIRQRVDAFVEFWSQRIQEEFGVAPPLARCLAGGVLSFADACARAWSVGRVGREEMEDGCVRFIVAGLHAALADRQGAGVRRAPRATREAR
jgi:AcrR family transcriptional regulator